MARLWPHRTPPNPNPCLPSRHTFYQVILRCAEALCDPATAALLTWRSAGDKPHVLGALSQLKSQASHFVKVYNAAAAPPKPLTAVRNTRQSQRQQQQEAQQQQQQPLQASTSAGGLASGSVWLPACLPNVFDLPGDEASQPARGCCGLPAAAPSSFTLSVQPPFSTPSLPHA